MLYHRIRLALASLLASASIVSTSSAALFIRELFDSAGADVSLGGQGAGLTSSLGFAAGSNWVVNAGGAIVSANNFDVESSPVLPGLPPQSASRGGLYRGGGADWATSIWATRALDANAQLNFTHSRVVYFSFRVNNAGDSSVGMGFTSGNTNFIGVGAHWNNAGGGSANNSIYIAGGTLSGNTPYGIRANTAAGTLNGTGLIVGRLTLNASAAADVLSVKLYTPGSTIETDPAAVTWSLNYSFTDAAITNMIANQLLVWLNGDGQAEMDAIRVGITWADVTAPSTMIVRELFDGANLDATLHGQGANLTSAQGFALGSTWAVNAGATMVSANNFDVVSGSPDTLPGLAPLSSTAGGLYNNGSDWNTAIWATRQLDTASRLNFAQSRTVYFSFRVNNTGDTAMGIGLADGNTGAANFVGVGAHWDNAGGGTANNSVYITGGALADPYNAIRANTGLGTLNGAGLIVGRLTLNAGGADSMDVKLYTPGSTIETDPGSVSWSLSYSFTDAGITNMTATHLVAWLNGSGAGQLDAIRVASTWADVTATPSLFVRELFDSAMLNASLHGQGDTFTSSTGFLEGSRWAVNAGGTMFTANNFDVVNGSPDTLPGLLPRLSTVGGMWKGGGNDWGTGIWGVRQLEGSSRLNFAQDRVVYFSYRFNNSGDTALGLGFANGSAASSAFIGVGAHWNNAGGGSANNSIYISDGTLNQGSGPYFIRANTAVGTVNGNGLLVGRLTLRASGAETLDVKLYLPGTAIDSDLTAIAWNLSYTINNTSVTNMLATHLLCWLNGSGTGQLDAFRVGNNWVDVTGVVANSPVITGQPQSLTVPCQSNATFTATVTGPAPLYYQWYKSTLAIPGANTNSLVLTNVNGASSGNYFMVVTNAYAASTSFVATLTVADTAAPTIYLPGDMSVTTTAADGTNVTYAATVLDNCDSSMTLQCSPASGSFFPVGQTVVNCTAADSVGNRSYSAFVVTVQSTVTPARPSIGFSFVGGGGVLAGAEVAGVSGYAQSNWNNLAGANSATAGAFPALIKDSFGAVVSLPSITYAGGPSGGVPVWFEADNTWNNTATTALPDGKMMRGYLDSNNGNTNRPFAAVMGIPYANYSVVVYFDGDDNTRTATGPYWLETFSTATNDLTPRVYGRDAGDFTHAYVQTPLSSIDSNSAAPGNYIVFTNLTSPEFRLRGSQIPSPQTRAIISAFQIVNTEPTPPASAPAIAAQPMSRTAVIGGSAGFQVLATGSSPLSYQWLKDGTPVPGANSSTLTLTSVTSNDVAGYTVAVTNYYGAVTSSPPATLTVLPVPSPAATNVIISEFMAANSSTLADEDGAFSDWIEVYNAGTDIVNLLDWSLTDNAGNLTKWRFPSTNIAPGQVIIVFASNKNRRTPGAPLHSNFQLSAGGEYLALVRPDGTIATQFSPVFLPQVQNVSFGFGTEIADTVVVASNASVRYYVPTNSTLDATWMQAGFDDSAWLTGAQGIGFNSGTPELVGYGSLVNQLKFDAPPASSAVYDSTPNSHVGTGANATWLASAGGRSGVMDFNATAPSQILVPPHSDFNSPTGTIAFWIRSSTNAGPGSEGAMIFDRRNVSGDVIVLYNTGKIFVQPTGGGSFQTTNGVADGNWHHVAYVYNQVAPGSGGFLRVYIDGVLSGSSTPNAWSWNTSQRLELGQSHDSYWRRLNGQLDEFSIYNRVLSLAEIASLAANTPVTDSSLKLRYDFDVPQGSPLLVDSSPSNHPGFGTSVSFQSTHAGRTGVMQFLAASPGQITIPPHADFNGTRGTIAFWMKSAGAIGTGNEGAMLFDRRSGGGDVIVLYNDGTIFCQAMNASGMVNVFHSASRVDDATWHHIAYVFDQNAGGGIAIYIDGVLNATNANSAAWFWNASQRIELGQSHDTWWRKFDGYLDDFRMWNRQLSADEIRIVALGDGQPASYAIGTDVSSIMWSNSPSAYLRLPFEVDDPLAVSRVLLRIRYDDGFVAYLNGNVAATRNAPGSPAWDTPATSRRSDGVATIAEEINLPLLYLTGGTNVVAIHGLNRGSNDSTFLVQAEILTTETLQVGVEPRYFAQPTPGQPNNAGTADLGPIITDVGHTPNVPGDAENLIVTAKVSPSFNPVRSITLHYRVNFGALAELPMLDDGAHGDGAAGDSVYGAIIPSALYVPNDMVRYYVTSDDALGRISRWPLFSDPLDSAEYLGTVVADPALTSSLPIFQLFVSSQYIGLIDTENGGRASLFYDGEFYDNIAVEQRGGTTASYPKKSHHLEFNREHKFRHPGHSLRIRDTSITSEFVDPTYLRQHLSFWIQRNSGGPAPFHYPVRLQRNGVFYQLGWHTDIVGNDLLENVGYDPDGALYKGIGQALPGSPEKKTRKWEGNADYNALAGAIRETNSIATRRTNFFELMDVPEVINYLAGARIVSENDDVWANMSVYRDSDGDGLWRVIPFDMNLSWGQLYYGDDTSINGSIQATNDNNKSHPLYGGATVTPKGTWNGLWNRIYDTVVQSPQLREMLLRRQRSIMDRFLQAPDTAPASLVLENYISTMTNLIWNEAFLDRQTWGWPANGGPYGFGPNQWLTNGVEALINQFINPRRTHLYATHSITNTARPIGTNNAANAGIPLGQPADAAVFMVELDYNPASANQGQEYLCLTNPNPYAVDLSGWQLDNAVNFTFPAGTVMPSNSLLYVVKDKVQFRARGVGPRGGQGLFVVGNYSGQLSARGESVVVKNDLGQPVSTNTYAGTPSLVQQFLRVTELMYHPPAGGAYAVDEYEFLELRNISGDTTIDLNGVKLTNGLSFVFGTSTLLTPGARLLLVKNQAAFESRYGLGLPVGGVYVGSLDNAGERLTIIDASNEEVLDFTYNNSWYPITDGLGFSLVVVDENAEPDAWSNKTQWRSSGALNGSPGAAEPAPASFAAIRINEVLTASTGTNIDLIELFNPASTNVDVGGWFLTDNWELPKKFRIPNGTVIAAGGFLVFTEYDFNAGGLGFAFSALGEEAYVFSGDANTNLTGYMQGFEFGAADTNVTFGRYVTSVGEEHFVAQSAPTFGATNAYPKIGPVVVTEIMYHPPDLGTNDNQVHEFIELQNISGAPVMLFDPEQTTNTWRLRGGVDYEFPTSLTLGAHSNVVLVSFDPAADTATAAAFRAHYGLSADVAIFGPYRGKLDNSDDTIRLQKPTALASNSGPFVLVEEVHYFDAAPWPAAADGTGQSLRRLHLFEYANDPVNWAAGAPTPGVVAPEITQQPGDSLVQAGSPASFNVKTEGTAPFRIASFFDVFTGLSVDNAGGNDFTHLIASAQAADTGSYTFVISNAAGLVTSRVAVLTVNRAPTARNFSARLTQNQALIVPAARLLGSASDPDGDVLTVLLSGGTSTNGGAVVLTNNVLAYTPVTDFVGVDQFSYQVSDGRGGSAQVAVTVNVVGTNAPSLNIVSAPQVVGTNFYVKFAGIPGQSYTIQSATAVTGPWATLTNITAGPNGLFDLLDPIGDPPPPSRFYRTKTP